MQVDRRNPNPMDHASPLEEAIDPGLPIIDSHHHLWGKSLTTLMGKSINDPTLSDFEFVSANNDRYLFEDYSGDIAMGHNIVASVFVQAHSMYNADGPAWRASVGETEFVNGIAAMSASGLYGPSRIAAGIVGQADLCDGAHIDELLDTHIKVGNGRFKGIRQSAAWDADPSVLGMLNGKRPELYLQPEFRAGFARLAPLGLTFDAWLLEPQLDDLVDLARQFPNTDIVLDHAGTPLGVGPYKGSHEARFATWRSSMRALAEVPNVHVKLGGLGMPFVNLEGCLAHPRYSSTTLAARWKPYIVECIEAFGASRCMFESDFPVDRGTADYATVWNAFKRIVEGASPEEKSMLFAGTARRFYRLP